MNQSEIICKASSAQGLERINMERKHAGLTLCYILNVTVYRKSVKSISCHFDHGYPVGINKDIKKRTIRRNGLSYRLLKRSKFSNFSLPVGVKLWKTLAALSQLVL